MTKDVLVLRARVVAEARSWVGCPYHHNAHVKGAGVDCVWLLGCVFFNAGVLTEPIDPGNYSREWYFHKAEEVYMAGVARYARRMAPVEPVLPGDLALYKIGKCVSHGAIIVDDDYLIHANRKAGQVEIMERRNPELVAHFHSYWTPFK